MVKFILFSFLFLPFVFLNSDEVKITAEIDPGGVVGAKLKGTITVTHNIDQKVDVNSFKLDAKTLRAEFLKKVQISPESKLIISIYNFTMEAKEKGLQILPPVKVKVGNTVFSSIPSTYEVKEQVEQPGASQGPRDVIFKVENIIIGDKILYPGQRIAVGYRYIFNLSMDLEKEVLPLLQARGFRKVGGKESKDYVQNNLNVVDITQKIEALEPGEYVFGSAEVSGRAYVENNAGKKQYVKGTSKSQTSSQEFIVMPFPTVGKPTSFNGAIGENYTIETKIVGSNVVSVGDKITFVIIIQGIGEIDNLPMPEVCCQPGYSGFFLVSDLPPDESVVENSKQFKVDIRPQASSINKIPELEFSYFNPKEKSYTSLKSSPIDLTVIEYSKKDSDNMEKRGQTKKIPELEKPNALKAIEIEGNFKLHVDDLEHLTFGTYWVLIVIPVGFLIIFLQIQFRNYIQAKKREERGENSVDLFNMALKEPFESPEFFRKIRESFLSRLMEIGEVEVIDTPTDKLKESEKSRKVRAFLQEMEELRFSGKEGKLEESFIEKAKNLFQEL